ncbi:precorrin-2 dehydrogenase/sirohydrochlorin ferrochelatase family protein [Pelotomaculum propionicicum]|uniref:precorrin-2 dehydrogenase n=1 Tax=Pelotomaculum propionicicum TaxID=258475 RepID=A0A4Y7RNY7_9FIRM|nr:bifunctional precorrin-2 dehydrogenase/sirohydrochlorin ferrochelatase [Pelotomaculum propionicicum]TEB10708.1 Siroheme synthase [Pelotomaculum propionicicum]
MSGRYLVSLDLENKRCLIVGGGSVAQRKAVTLLECGALVHLVSPEVTPLIEELARQGKISHRRGCYESSDLEGMFLVIGASGREDVNRQVADDCLSRNLIVNIVDDPNKGNFFVPATVRRGALEIAVSTGGKSPLLARKIREELEKTYGEQYGEFLDMLGVFRQETIANISEPEKKKRMLESFVDEKILSLLKEGHLDLVKEMLVSAYRGSGR